VAAIGLACLASPAGGLLAATGSARTGPLGPSPGASGPSAASGGPGNGPGTPSGADSGAPGDLGRIQGPHGAPSAGQAGQTGLVLPASLRLLTEEFPPINFSEGGVPRGLTVDLVQAIQQRLGQDLPIQVLPWARAFREAQESAPTALFATARIPERESLFQWVGPVVQFRSTFYARANVPVATRTLDDARHASRVLVVRDWYTAQQLRTAGFRNLQTVTDPVQGIRMLMAGRAPLMAGERVSMPRTLELARVKPTQLRELFSFAVNEGYIAFSLSTPKATVAAWQARLQELKRDGTFQAIYRRWLPNEPLPRS
jgi:polar amino acid transport system substrate-binding protein